MSPLGKSVQRKQTKIKLGLSIWKLFSAILLANKNLLLSTERSSLVLYWSICSLMQDFSPLSFLSPTSTLFSTCAMLYVQKKTLLAQALRKHKYFFPSSFKRIESGHFSSPVQTSWYTAEWYGPYVFQETSKWKQVWSFQKLLMSSYQIALSQKREKR